MKPTVAHEKTSQVSETCDVYTICVTLSPVPLTQSINSTPIQPTRTLSIVILNWNAAQDTLACVQRLLAWQRLHPHIIIVDNASTSAEIEALSTFVQANSNGNITLICNPHNQGFAGGSNRGIEHALAQHPSLPILLLNNDADITESDLIKLHDALMADATLGAIGPVLYTTSTDALPHIISAGGKDPRWHIHTLYTQIDTTSLLMPVHYISGSVALFRAEVFHNAGLLDEAFFFNTEIADLCQRAAQHPNHYRTMVHTQAQAFHDLHRSASNRHALYVYYIVRNRLLYVRKHGGAWRIPLLMGWALYGLALYIRTRIAGQRAPANAIGLGTLDGLRGRFGGQNERVLRLC